MVFLHKSSRKPYAEIKHIAGTQPNTMAVLVGYLGVSHQYQPLLLFGYQSQDRFVPCAGGSGSVQLEWLLFGSSGCSVAPGYGRMEVLSISAVHSDSLGEVINFIYLLVCFVVFVLIYPLPS